MLIVEISMFVSDIIRLKSNNYCLSIDMLRIKSVHNNHRKIIFKS